MELIRTISTWGIHYCTLGFYIFIFLYLYWARPFKTEYGRLILFKSSILALIFTFISARNIFGDTEFLQLARGIAFLGIPFFVTWQIWLLYRVQRRGE